MKCISMFTFINGGSKECGMPSLFKLTYALFVNPKTLRPKTLTPAIKNVHPEPEIPKFQTTVDTMRFKKTLNIVPEPRNPKPNVCNSTQKHLRILNS